MIRGLICGLSSELSAAGIENARFETECIAESVGIPRIKLLTEPEAPVPEETEKAAREKISRRRRGEPLQYILGEWEFYGYPFKVGEGVLIPRQDTETLAELAVSFLEKRGGKPLAADLCAGSGCIGITLAKRLGCEVKCFELSEAAFGYLEQNIALNGVESLVTPILADVLNVDTDERFDLIAANPPYLTKRDMETLQREVAFEPGFALYGGEDGLDLYRGILPRWSRRLKSGGLIAVEIGIGQEKDVMRIFAENGIEPGLAKDACGIYRVVYGTAVN